MFKFKPKRYMKLFAAIAGVGLLLLFRNHNLSTIELNSFVTELIIGAFTAFGVYQVRNED